MSPTLLETPKTGFVASRPILLSSFSDLCKPEQVHIAFGNSLIEIVILWSTRAECKESEVHYRTSLFGKSDIVHGTTSKLPGYVNFPYIHKVTLIVSILHLFNNLTHPGSFSSPPYAK